MKILHISDTHGKHDQLTDKWDWNEIDMVLHSGDASNYYESIPNKMEYISFLEWFSRVPVKYKILIAGNHDTSVERNLMTPGDIASYGVIYLEHQLTQIENIKIFGSPYTPTFGKWSFMRDRSKLDKFWSQIPEDVDILMVHGPAMGINDLSWNRDGGIDMCGCKSLSKHLNRIKPKVFQFGHIHNNEGITNYGIKIHNETFNINATLVTDGRFDLGLTQFGILSEMDENKHFKILKIK